MAQNNEATGYVKIAGEPCIDCGKPMVVTGRNVVLGGINVGTTWECRNPECFSRVMFDETRAAYGGEDGGPGL